MTTNSKVTETEGHEHLSVTLNKQGATILVDGDRAVRIAVIALAAIVVIVALIILL